jgi:hypothetical protein
MFTTLRRFNRYLIRDLSWNRLKNTLFLMFIDSAHLGSLAALPAPRFSSRSTFIVPNP